MAMSEFTDVQCHMGVDLASKKDLTAISILFRKEYNYYAFAKFYAPEAAAQENEYYRKFHTSGDLILTPGNMTDYRFVLEDIYELCSRFPVLSIAFDDHQAVFLMTLLQERGLNVVQYPQTTVMMSDPMKEIDARVDNGQLWHDGNPVLTWNMGNVVANENAKQHIYPRRENEKDPKCKIDGVVALIMSMGRWLNDNEPVSYLHNSGVEFI
jgi:phage terminase large subunit-like protein